MPLKQKKRKQRRSQDKQLKRLLGVIVKFRQHSPEITAKAIQSFLAVADAADGVRIQEICKRTGFTYTTVNRHMLDLGRNTRKRRVPASGPRLISSRGHPDKERLRLYFLTAKGRALSKSISASLKSR